MLTYSLHRLSACPSSAHFAGLSSLYFSPIFCYYGVVGGFLCSVQHPIHEISKSALVPTDDLVQLESTEDLCSFLYRVHDWMFSNNLGHLAVLSKLKPCGLDLTHLTTLHRLSASWVQRWHNRRPYRIYPCPSLF